jgi:hypothetical protein
MLHDAVHDLVDGICMIIELHVFIYKSLWYLRTAVDPRTPTRRQANGLDHLPASATSDGAPQRDRVPFVPSVLEWTSY